MPADPTLPRRMINLNDRDLESVIQDLFEIRRDEPCKFWTGHGCEASMVSNADQIIRLVDGLIPPQRMSNPGSPFGV